MIFNKLFSGLAWSFIGLILLLVLYINYDSHLSKESGLATKNAENIRKVKTGMDTLQVVSIMGQPQAIALVKQDHIYHYTHKPGFSHSYQVKFDASYKVIEVNIID